MNPSRSALPVPFESPLPQRLRWLPTALAIAAVCLPVFFAFQHAGVVRLNVVTILVTLAFVAIILARHTAPRLMAGVTIAVVVGSVVLASINVVGPGLLVAGILAVMITVFGVGTQLGRNATVLLMAAAVVSIGVAVLVAQPTESRGLESLVMVLALVGLAGSAGIARHNGRAYIAAITERARQAEETRESEAERRVTEERLAIARDLHDVMAHQIAVINLHAASASQALRQRPDDAERSLSTIRAAARTVLGDIAGLLSVLRSRESVESDTLVPAPGLEQLPALIEGFTRAGLRVEQRTVGSPVELDSLRDIAAYRLVQEALTNAHKHGDDQSALLQLDYDNQGITVTVTNVIRSEGDERVIFSGGHGLVGARERVSAMGGRLETSFGPGPVHRFVAHLPDRQERS